MIHRRIHWVSQRPAARIVAPAGARIMAPAPGAAETGDELPQVDPPLPPRDEAIFLLQVAAEIEHALMVQYLYAAFSLREPGEVPADQAARQQRWRDSLMQISREEMGHLLTVQNVLRLLGGPLHFDRGDYPLDTELHPFTFHLEPLSRASLAKYVIAEMPERVPDELKERVERIRASVPHEVGHVHRVGRLYARLEELLAQFGEDDLARGASDYLGTASEWRAGGGVLVPIVMSLKEAGEAFRQISLQGEGLHLDPALPSHFERFLQMYEEWPEADDWTPSRPVPTDPVPAAPGAPAAPEQISHPASRLWAQLFDLRYRRLLQCLAHSLLVPREGTTSRAFLVEVAFREMTRVLGPVARRLTELPRSAEHPAREQAAGPCFRMPYSTDLPDREEDRWRAHDELLTACASVQERVLAACEEARDQQLIEELRQADAADRLVIAREREHAVSPGGSAPRPVAVVGAGPAGLAAAMALSQRGVPVVLLERASRVGGKVESHREGGRSLEHGIHGWWMNYLNFDRLLRDSGVDPGAALKTANGSMLVLPDGRRFELYLFKVDLPSPLYLMLHMLRAPFLSLRDAVSAIRFFIHLLAFDHDADYARYDGFSFQALMDHCRVPERLQRALLEPFILSFDFAKANRVSAACGMSGTQFYVIHDQHSIVARWAKHLPADAVFGPITHELKRRGVRLRVSTPVERVAIQDGCATGVSLAASSGGASAPALRVAVNDLPDGTFQEQATPAGPIWIRRSGAAVTALSGRCTHQGCHVQWRQDASAFVCPCHGGRYDAQGKVLQGPPPAPLAPFPVRVQDGVAEVLGPTASETVSSEDVIVATDLEAAKRILKASPGVPASLLANMARLETTPVFVVRLWFDGPLPASRVESALTAEFPFIDNFFDVSSYAQDVAGEGHVIEVQSYRVDSLLDRSDEEILAIALSDLAIVYPSYKGVTPKHWTLNRHLALFTRYGPGQHPYRPTEESGVEGVVLAGDWTQAPWSVWMMERAVVSGLRAANAVLRRRGLQEVEILRLPREHWFLRLSRAACRVLRWAFARSLPAPEPLAALPLASESAVAQGQAQVQRSGRR